MELHWDTMIDIQFSIEYLKFLNKDYNYMIEQNVKNARQAVVVWVTSSKIKRKPSVKASFITAVCISQMNLLTPFREINQQYINDGEAPYK